MLAPFFRPKNTVTNYIDASSRRVMYRVVSPAGATLADAIETERLARQIACIDEMYDAFTFTLGRYRSHMFDCVYDLRWDAGTWEELALDKDGEYERDYPGLPEEAQLVVLFGEIEDFVEHPQN